MGPRSLVALLVIVSLVLLLSISSSYADPNRPSSEFFTLDQVSFGTLLFRIEEGSNQHVRAPLLSSTYEISVTGTIARTTLTQRFINPSDFWLEGIYAFPLPHAAAIDGLRMRIGDRFIEGQIKEKKAARRTYQAAKKAGKRTALLVQHRPNLFTNSVANIGPHESVIVQITYQQVIEPDTSIYELRVPLVAAPRYEKAPVVQLLTSGPGGWKPINPNPIAKLTNAAIQIPDTDGSGTIHNPVDVTVSLSPGFPIGEINSGSHTIDVARNNDGAVVVNLESVPADRDFVLTWSPQDFENPEIGLFKETRGDAVYYLAIVTPPRAEKVRQRTPRNIIFVQDISGSMSGESIRQALAGLRLALKRLSREDRFNVYYFNNKLYPVFRRLMPATLGNVSQSFITTEHIRAKGGTEMLPALKAALRLAQRENDGRLTQIVFLTDGEVSNEAAMMKAINSGLGDSRLFTVGIGSSPNSYFMSAAADIGRGSTVYVNDLETVAERMDQLFTKLETPVLTDLEIQLPENASRLTPNPMPDLYAGEPLVVAFMADQDSAGAVRITGKQGAKSVELVFDRARATERPGIAKLWARRHIEGIERLRASSITDATTEAKLDTEILDLALRHHLVSRRTSLVAVDVTPVRSAQDPLHSRQIANNLPKGWDPKAFLSPTNDQHELMRASLSPEAEAYLQNAALKVASRSNVKLPKTSLDWLPLMLVGLLLLAFSSGLLIWVSERQRGRAVGSSSG